MKIFYLKPNSGHEAGDIVEQSDKYAKELIKKGIARQVKTRDYLVKPSYGFNAVSRAFKKKIN